MGPSKALASAAPSTGLKPGPLERYLMHPGAGTARLLHRLDALAHLGPTVGPALAAASLAVASGVARLVRVLAPPEVDAEGAATLWSNLVALLRPAWRRVLAGQPHIGFELTARTGVLGVAFWVPGLVPPGLVERAVEASWPGARTDTVPAGPPIPDCGLATGGELRLVLPEHYPLRTEHKVDPLRSPAGMAKPKPCYHSQQLDPPAKEQDGARIGRQAPQPTEAPMAHGPPSSP
jgi:hypothetical protein